MTWPTLLQLQHKRFQSLMELQVPHEECISPSQHRPVLDANWSALNDLLEPPWKGTLGTVWILLYSTEGMWLGDTGYACKFISNQLSRTWTKPFSSRCRFKHSKTGSSHRSGRRFVSLCASFISTRMIANRGSDQSIQWPSHPCVGVKHIPCTAFQEHCLPDNAVSLLWGKTSDPSFCSASRCMWPTAKQTENKETEKLWAQVTQAKLWVQVTQA